MAASLASLIHLVAWLIYVLVLIRVILSWLPLLGVHVPSYHPGVLFVKQVTDPLLRPFQRLLPPWKTSGIDFSPLLLLLVVNLAERILLGLLRGS
jgi:YggT family protein